MSWAKEDNAKAIKEGWYMVTSLDGAKIYKRLWPRDHSFAAFRTNEAAYDSVLKKAAGGSEFHQRAIAHITEKRLTQ